MSNINKKLLDEVLASQAKAFGVPGASMAIWHKDETITSTYGVLNKDLQTPVIEQSMFQIGSISKVFTATLVMQLVEQGKVELDKPLKHYMPEFSVLDISHTNEVTVRMLLNHTNGLAGDANLEVSVREDALKLFVERCAMLPNSHEVGKSFSYSNAAFNIAGRLVEVITGLRFENALEELIFKPLGLKDACCDITKMVGKSVSAGHWPDAGQDGDLKVLDTIFTLDPGTTPAGSTIVMSPTELIKFGVAHLKGESSSGEPLLGKEFRELMTKPTVDICVPPRDIAKWGLGWAIMEHLNGRTYGHDGMTIGQCAYMRIDPVSESIAVLFLNGGSANDCMSSVFQKTFDQITGYMPNPAPTIAKECPYKLESIVGMYKTVTGDYEVTLIDGVLHVSTTFRVGDELIDFGKNTPIYYAGNDTFITEAKNGSFPANYTFLDFMDDGVPRAMFSGLRVIKRQF